MKTILHELSHVDIQRILKKISNFDAKEVDILIRYSNIANSEIKDGVVVVKRENADGTVSFVPLEGFENVTTAEDLEDLQKEYEHIIIVEKYAEDQAESIQSTVESDPDTFGSFDIIPNDNDLKKNSNAYKVMALSREAPKEYYKTLFDNATTTRPSGEFIRDNSGAVRSALLK